MCVGVILQLEINTPGVISSNDKITPFSHLEEIHLHNQSTTYDIFHHINGCLLFCPNNSMANVDIYYRWDRIALCAGIIFQCAASTPGVISSYHDMIPFFMQQRDSILHVIKSTTYGCVRVILPREISTRGVNSLYYKITTLSQLEEI